MAYRKYTECVSSQKYSGPPWGNAVATGIAAAILYTSLTILITQALGAAPLVVTAIISILSALIVYCRWWLYGRLVCLGGNRCAIGLLVSVEPPENKSGFDALDTDYSINLVLAPHHIGEDQATIENDGIQGHLIKEQQASRSKFLPFRGERAKGTAVLHCEFEGAGVYDFYIACLAALGIATAAGVAAALCLIPAIGWIAYLIAYILSGIAVATALIGLFVGLSDKGSPTDVNPNLGVLHPEQDLLVVQGEWVYDSAHEGWNEIHPIKHAQRIGVWNGAWPDDVEQEIARWCEAIDRVAAPLTTNNQKKPEHQWHIHPMIDGCQPNNDIAA